MFDPKPPVHIIHLYIYICNQWHAKGWRCLIIIVGGGWGVQLEICGSTVISNYTHKMMIVHISISQPASSRCLPWNALMLNGSIHTDCPVMGLMDVDDNMYADEIR